MIEGRTPTSIQNVDAFGNAIPPTNYGLGRGAVTTNLASFRIVSNNGSGVVTNTTLSSVLQAPYQGNSWPLWSQHFCFATCHRDAQIMTAQVRTADFAGQPTRTYLNRQVPKTGGGTGLPNITRCVKCPPFQATYTWTMDAYNNYLPADPRNTFATADCMPWFGSVPRLALYGSTTSYTYPNTTRTDHSASTDGILVPTESIQVPGVPCPVNTYNDRCADYFLLTAQALVQPSDQPSSITVTQPQCMPCPAGGYHTGGQVGAWFCYPPFGQTAWIESTYDDPLASPTRIRLNLYTNSTTNGSLAWARRDILGYEWECGITAEHCYQCGSVPGADSTWTPVQFNERIILPNLLRCVCARARVRMCVCVCVLTHTRRWQACPSGYYCPTALQVPVACPAGLPWSPPGSWSVANCSCARGTYLQGSGQCQPCLSLASCPGGTYRAGWTQCTQQNGATSPGTCTPCSNKPANAQYTADAGLEMLAGPGASYIGVCSFVCPLYTALGSAGGLMGACSAPYTCDPMPPLYSAPPNNKLQVYQPQLRYLTDGFFVASATLSCRIQTNLSSAAAAVVGSRNNNNAYLPVSTSCQQATPSPCGNPGVICAVSANATFYSDFACAPCPAAPPANGQYAIDSSGLAFGCAVACLPNYYLNGSACVSCAVLDALCAAANSGGGAGWHIRGGGCYGNNVPLPNLTANLPQVLRTNCVQCDKAPTSNDQSYLDIADVGTPAFCTYVACQQPLCATQNPPTCYLDPWCGGSTRFAAHPCRTSCPAGQYLSGACTVRADRPCAACTAFQPGYYLLSNCTGNADAVWQRCGMAADGSGAFTPGFYCPGDGSMLPCPFHRTSPPGAANLATQCVCPAGTAPLDPSSSLGPCAQRLCPNATALGMTFAPGAGWRAASYAAPGGACLPCSPPAPAPRSRPTPPATASGSARAGARSAPASSSQPPRRPRSPARCASRGSRPRRAPAAATAASSSRTRAGPPPPRANASPRPSRRAA